jgi:predicted GNAT family N-acyltransferase
MYRIKKFTTKNKDLSSIAFDIRNKVFVEEQKVDRAEEYDRHEDESNHFLLLKNEEPIGTARWRFTDNGIKLERFAILKEHRNGGAGTFLVNEVLKDVLPHNKNIYLNAQVRAINVYAR